jgi:hypothetical protein
MTEAVWLGDASPNLMMDFIHTSLYELGDRERERRSRSIKRKERLLGVACCRRIWSLIADDVRHCVEIAERFADDAATSEDLRAAREKALAKWIPSGGWDSATKACELICAETADAHFFLKDAVVAAVTPRRAALGFVNRGLTNAEIATDKALVEAEAAKHREYIRDLFGNPFRKQPKFNKKWRTSTAVALAKQMYESRDFSTMPILADELQDAGCENEEILNHCRQAGEHVRGCWVVDQVLGKE